jgi:hypothetical protein
MGASTRERSPQAEHSTVSQTGFTAVPAASSSEAFSCSTFSAAATASNGLTVAGSAFVAVAASAVATGSSGASETTRKPDSLCACFFGVRPCRIVSASTVSRSFV